MLFSVTSVVLYDSVENSLSSFLTVVNSKADFHIFARLELAICQLLEEVEDDICVIGFIFVHELRHGRFCLSTTFDEFKELVEFDFTVLVNSIDHILDLLSSIDKTKSNQRVLKLINSDSRWAILIEVFKAFLEDLHLLIVEVNVLRFAMLAEPLALNTPRLMLWKEMVVSWNQQNLRLAPETCRRRYGLHRRFLPLLHCYHCCL